MTNVRNTPTGVGKTWSRCHRQQTSAKHPHGRGEDAAGIELKETAVETPPRAWGRHQDIVNEKHPTYQTLCL